MAKIKIKEKAKTAESNIVPITKGGLPAELDKMMQADAGKGVSAKPEDNLVPMMSILQDVSPECQRKNSKYIEGCEGGQIWLKNSVDPFVNGEEGIMVQHCHSFKAIVEWRPRLSGGGFIGQHSMMPDDAREVPDPQDPNKKKMVRKNGNELIDTRHEVVRVFRENDRLQYVIPFTSTGHTVAKGWNTLRGQFHLSNGDIAPTFSKLYHLTTKSRTNQKGTWFLFNVDPVDGWVNREDYIAGLALYKAFNRGEKKADTSTFDEPASDGDDM